MVDVAMNERALLVGTWHVVSPVEYSDASQSVYRLTEDGRWVHFVEMPKGIGRAGMMENEAGKLCLVPVRLWYEFEGEDIMRLRPSRTHEGWRRRFSIVEGALVIESIDDTEPRQWVSERVPEGEAPLWFEAGYIRALERKWR